jgi:WD40 repeat protein
MPRESAQSSTAPATVSDFTHAQNRAEIEIGEIERWINENQERPLSIVLKGVIERVRSLTDAEGALIGVCDVWGVVCRASVGKGPDVGSKLHSEPTLTSKCIETGRVVICEETEEDFRERLAPTRWRLRSVVVVPIHVQGLVRGVVEVLSSRAAAFSTEHVAQLQSIAHLLVPVLQEEEEEEPQPKARGGKKAVWTAVGGAALLLALLLLRFEFYHRPKAVPSATADRAAFSAANPSEPRPTTSAATTTPETEEAKRPRTSDRDEVVVPAPRTSSPAFPLPSAGPAAAPAEKPPGVVGPELTVVPPPALVIEGAPPGAQIFVDDQLTGSTSSNGETEVSTLSPGRHRLRVKVNGYQDYEKGFDQRTGQTSRIAAKLEPFELPPLTEPAKAPSLAFSPTIPGIASPSVPEFVPYRTLKAHSGWVTGVAFSADGQRLASSSSDQTVKFWDVPTGQETTTVASRIKEVQALALSRDGHWLAAENSSNTVTLWDAATGQQVRTLSSNKPLGVLGSSWVYSIAFSPDSRWLASGVDDKTVRLWDVATGRSIRDLTASHRSVIYAAFSPDGRWLASGGNDETIKIWEAATGKEIRTLRGHKKNVYAVVFSPNGRYLASASADKRVKLWDVTTGREMYTLAGHGSDVTSIAFSPDSRWLASGSWDRTIKIWDVQTGREVRTLTGYNHHIYAVAFDSHGHWLASGSEDGTIKLWRLTQR